jgi:hypothetical protein
VGRFRYILLFDGFRFDCASVGFFRLDEGAFILAGAGITNTGTAASRKRVCTWDDLRLGASMWRI